LSTIEPTVAGPKRPQDKILLKNFKSTFIDLLDETYGRKYITPEERQIVRWTGEGGSQPVIHPPLSSAMPATVETKEKDGLKVAHVTIGTKKYLLSDGA